MKRISFDISEGDLEILKENAAKQQYDLEDYISMFFSEKMRPLRAEKFKREKEAREKNGRV